MNLDKLDNLDTDELRQKRDKIQEKLQKQIEAKA